MIFFRIDLSDNHGLGHYNRIKSLINYLDLTEYKIVIDELPKIPFFKSEEKNILPLYGGRSLFRNEREDAKNFVKITKCKTNKSIVVKDSYRLGFTWEKYISKHCKKIISIEDFLDKKHFVDYYINHSPFFLENKKNYSKTLKLNNKKDCKFLLGPGYALFNSTYNNKKKIVSDFVFYNGGSGDPLIYKKILQKIGKMKNNFFKINVIIGPLAKNRDYEKIFKKYRNIKIVYHPSNILNILNGTKVFISSAGVSMFESSFLKIPTLLFKMSVKQGLSELEYEKLGHYFSLSKVDLKHTSKIVNLIKIMYENNSKIKKMMLRSSVNKRNIKKNFKKNLKL